MFVLLLDADVHLVHLDRTRHQLWIALERLADAMAQVPRCPVVGAGLPMQLVRGYALEVRDHEIQRQHPRSEAELRDLHDDPALDAEAPAALTPTTPGRISLFVLPYDFSDWQRRQRRPSG